MPLNKETFKTKTVFEENKELVYIKQYNQIPDTFNKSLFCKHLTKSTVVLYSLSLQNHN